MLRMRTDRERRAGGRGARGVEGCLCIGVRRVRSRSHSRGRAAAPLMLAAGKPATRWCICGERDSNESYYLSELSRYDWGDSEILDSPKLGELRFRSKTKAGPLEDKQLSRAGNIALVR